MIGKAAVGCQVAGGDRFDSVEGLIAIHDASTCSSQFGFEQPPKLLLRAVQLCLDGAERQIEGVAIGPERYRLRHTAVLEQTVEHRFRQLRRHLAHPRAATRRE